MFKIFFKSSLLCVYYCILISICQILTNKDIYYYYYHYYYLHTELLTLLHTLSRMPSAIPEILWWRCSISGTLSVKFIMTSFDLLWTTITFQQYSILCLTLILLGLYIIRIAVNKDWTKHLRVSKGVLQGDPCSPLLFNLCFNTLMHILQEKKLNNLGYIWGPDGYSNECPWLQFADDAVVISNSVRDAQTLVDIFSSWCTWAKMDIRLDKCCTYGAGKRNGVYSQLEPQLFINSQSVPAISQGYLFTYLGRIFDFNMKTVLLNMPFARNSTVHWR